MIVFRIFGTILLAIGAASGIVKVASASPRHVHRHHIVLKRLDARPYGYRRPAPASPGVDFLSGVVLGYLGDGIAGATSASGPAVAYPSAYGYGGYPGIQYYGN